MAREVKKVVTNVTRPEAEEAMQQLAKANSQLKRIEARIEQEKQKIDDRYKSEVLALQEQKKVQMEIVEVWAKKDLPNWDGKSFDLIAGTCGFRTGTPKVEKDKKFTWGAVTTLLEENFPFLVRTKTEPDKEAIIALRDDPEFEKISKTCHIEVVQDETFFVVPKEEELTAA